MDVGIPKQGMVTLSPFPPATDVSESPAGNPGTMHFLSILQADTGIDWNFSPLKHLLTPRHKNFGVFAR